MKAVSEAALMFLAGSLKPVVGITVEQAIGLLDLRIMQGLSRHDMAESNSGNTLV